MMKWLGWSAGAAAALVMTGASACGKAPAVQNTEDETEMLSEIETGMETVNQSKGTVTAIEESADGTAFDEITLVDNETCLISVRSTDENLSDGYLWQFHFENRTKEDLAFRVTDTAIGDYMSVADESGEASAAAAAGSETDIGLNWTRDDLDQMQVRDIENVSFLLGVFSLKDGKQDYKLYEEFTIRNLEEAVVEQRESVTEAGEAVTEAGEAVTESGEAITEAGESATEAGETVTEELETCASVPEDTSEQVLLNQNGCLAVLQSWGEDSFGDPVLNLYFENNTDQIILFKLTDLHIDGIRQDLKKDQVVLPGKKAIVPMSLWSISLQEDENPDPKKVEGKLGAWRGSAVTGDAFTESVTVEFVTEK